ncbi:pyruvate:ferredoxin (flavodoxin) oxidoreductase [Candidatus Poribacteria bacterium]|nr:pyruvate:ferredoxin (flavodoxin) oxidoreductase [Candidatus Poribacteria bacterium]
MSKPKITTIDGNEATAYGAYYVNEVIAIYPITPSSPMGEHADDWAAKGEKNIWGTVPQVVEMQSEGGAAGALHGSLQTGALTTTFTASQGLLLMIPNMYKIAGELTSGVINVAARSLATHALSIFCDHSDVMATRTTGFALIASNSVQEVVDFALISQMSTLDSRVPFLHFFDGFRTSHEYAKIELPSLENMQELIDNDLVKAHRERALSPDRPFIRGTAQNPDVFFQAREACNPFYFACPEKVKKAMDKFAGITGRKYHLFDYVGAPDAERVAIIMGSSAETAQETVDYLMNTGGEKVGVLKVHLYRPFSVEDFVNSLPSTVKGLAVLDRTKEPGSSGEPLYLDVLTGLNEAIGNDIAPFDTMPKVIGGRYGLSSKDFTPAMVKAVLDELKKDKPKNHFTIGIDDDVTHTSLDYDPKFDAEDPKRVRALFYGLGSDGTVSANKNSIKIIGEDTENYAQGYFVYDSKKAGSVTTSHLRFGENPITSPYLIDQGDFVACHQFSFLERFNVLKKAEKGATFLLNSPYGPDEVWDHLPRTIQKEIIDKELKFYVVDAYKVAGEAGMGNRINTVMQTCFFAISGILPQEEAIPAIKQAIKKAYGKRGPAIVQMNYTAVDNAVANLHEVEVPDEVTSDFDIRPPVPDEAPEFVKNVTAKMMAGEGDELPVSAMPVDGTFPSGTTKWEKRNIAQEIPVWDPDTCIQCGRCVFICPHAVIRSKVYEPALLEDAPETFKSTDAKWGRSFKDMKFTVQVAPEDCTGCGLCAEICPAKNKQEPDKKALNMELQAPLREQELTNREFFDNIPRPDRKELNLSRVKDLQLVEPLFEFSGACAGCGEAPYVKLLSKLFGDRTMISNATGCSSIYGGNLPTTPYTVDKNGRGPSWSNSLFEDNAEFGFGMRLALDKQNEYAKELVGSLSSDIGEDLAEEILNADQSDDAGIEAQRNRVAILKDKLASIDKKEAKELLNLADVLVKKSVWVLGGDGWAYDIGYGGLDHVLAMGRNINILVLDTEVYSNTGGQMSKSTPRAAVARFAAAGKKMAKKDLAMMLMTYGNIYVARVAMGANEAQTVRAFREAEAYDGPSIILAYSPCTGHGYDMVNGPAQQKAAVDSGHWPLVRYNPDLTLEGKNPLQLDSKDPSIPLEDYVYNETRYSVLKRSKPEEAKALLEMAQDDVKSRWKLYKHWASMPVDEEEKEEK